MVFQTNDNHYQISKYFVDAAGDTPYSTIQSALDAANAAGIPATVYVRPGTYTEDLSLYDDISIAGAIQGNSIIVGVHTIPNTGDIEFSNIYLRAPLDTFIEGGANTTNLTLQNCLFENTNGILFDLSNSTGELNVINCRHVDTGNAGVIGNAAGCTLNIIDSQLGSNGGDKDCQITDGILNIINSEIRCFTTVDGSTVGTFDQGSKFNNTISTAGTATVNVDHTFFDTGANAAISHGSGNAITLSEVTIDSTAVPPLQGAGAGNVVLGSVTYLNETGAAGTLTKVYTTRVETGELKLDDADQGALRVNAGVVSDIQGENILFVGKHGNDANDGRVWENAFLTIQAAVTAADAGDTILVDPGTYTETVTHAANSLTLIGRGKPNTCVITQADANVINFATYTGIQYKNFKIQCTAATTAINTVQGSTGFCSFKECQLYMTTSADIAAANQPGIGEITGAGTINVTLGKLGYYHTGNGGGTAQKAAFTVANGGLIELKYVDEIEISNTGTALATAVGIDLASTGNITVDECNIDITDPNATNVVGLAYLGGTGTTNVFYRNTITVTVQANTGYGFFASDTASTSRFFYNHITVADTGGASYAYHIGNTATVISHFDDLVSGDGIQLIAGGTFTEASSNSDGSITATNNMNATTFDTNVAAAGATLSGTTLAVDGTDANIDVTVTPKGTGVLYTPNLGYAANTTHIAMSAAGEVTMPLQPAFLAYLGTTDADVTGNGTIFQIGSGNALTEVYDQNSDFNTNGTFTAPVTGRYHFTAGVTIAQGAGIVSNELKIETSNRTYHHTKGASLNGGNSGTIITTCEADMDAADTAQFKIDAAGIGADTADVYGTNDIYTWFSGFLVC